VRLWELRILSFVGSTDHYLLLRAFPSAPARGSGRYRLTPIHFPPHHHRPDDPGDLVGLWSAARTTKWLYLREINAV